MATRTAKTERECAMRAPDPLSGLVTWRLMVCGSLRPAYIDPGSGSFLVQILLAGLLGALLSVRLWLGHVLAFVGRFGRGGGAAQSDSAPDRAKSGEGEADDVGDR